MPRKRCLILSICFFIIFALIPFRPIECKNVEMQSAWTNSPITVDGGFADWDGKPLTFFDDQKVAVGFCNDGDNLYIHFRTKDQMTASMIKMTGLTAYFDIKGKKKKDFYIKYNDGPAMKNPMGRGQNMPPQRDNSGEQPPDEGDNKASRPGANADPILTCYIKDVIVEKIIPVDGSEGPMAAYKKDGEFYSYEMAIPLKASGVRDYGLGLERGKLLSVGLKWGGMPEREGRGGGMRMGGGPGGGMPGGGGPGGGGGMPGGGPGGGGPGGGPGGGNRPDMPEEQEIWMKVTSSSGPTAPSTETKGK